MANTRDFRYVPPYSTTRIDRIGEQSALPGGVHCGRRIDWDVRIHGYQRDEQSKRQVSVVIHDVLGQPAIRIPLAAPPALEWQGAHAKGHYRGPLWWGRLPDGALYLSTKPGFRGIGGRAIVLHIPGSEAQGPFTMTGERDLPGDEAEVLAQGVECGRAVNLYLNHAILAVAEDHPWHISVLRHFNNKGNPPQRFGTPKFRVVWTPPSGLSVLQIDGQAQVTYGRSDKGKSEAANRIATEERPQVA